MQPMTAADFFLRLPPKKRRSVMLKAAREATAMQRKILDQAKKTEASALRKS